MKKIISIMTAAVLGLALMACGTKKEAAPAETAQQETAAQTQAETPAETPAEAPAAAGMANPMVEITDSAEFEKQLGIPLEPVWLYYAGEVKMFITDGKMAECQFSFQNPMQQEVRCVMRATKDSELAKNLPGVYDTLEEVNVTDYQSVSGAIPVRLQTNKAGDLNVYTWKAGDIWYSLTAQGEPSQMELAELMDSAMAAAGLAPEQTAGAPEAAPLTAEWFELSGDRKQLTVRLAGNATTGYQWSARIRDEATLRQVSENYAPDAAAAGMVGSGGTWVAVFEPVGTEYSLNEISFIYARPWESVSVVPSCALDLRIEEGTMEVLTIHEPDLTKAPAEDGEYDIHLSYSNMLEENAQSCYALIDFTEPVILSDAEAGALKPGDVIDMSRYPDVDNVEVQMIEKQSGDSIRINEEERLVRDPALGGWKILGWDDDVTYTVRDQRLVHFTNETEIKDGMEEVMKTGEGGTIYERMSRYGGASARIKVKDGAAESITIHYHP